MILSPYRKRRRRRIHRHLAWRAELASRPKRSAMGVLEERQSDFGRMMSVTLANYDLGKWLQDEARLSKLMWSKGSEKELSVTPRYEWKPYSLGFRVDKEAKQ